MPSRPVWHRTQALVRGDHAPRYAENVDSYVVEPQSLFVPYLSDVLAGAELRVVRVVPTLDVDDIRASHPEALFVDTDYLDVDPADAVTAMREAVPSAFICAYTDGEGALADRLRFAGANCVLSKRSGAVEIADVLRTARKRGTFTDPRCN
jgi:DNA-binding NarL/FixJ family response regulator